MLFMIQRIQSLYLFFAFVFAMFFVFFSEFSPLKEHLSSIPAFMSILSAILSVSIIFLYKNRKKQLLLLWLAIGFSISAMVCAVVFDSGKPFYQDYPFYLSVASFLTLLLARRGILKDEELIQSSNRLR